MIAIYWRLQGFNLTIFQYGVGWGEQERTPTVIAVGERVMLGFVPHFDLRAFSDESEPLVTEMSIKSKHFLNLLVLYHQE